MAILGRLTLTHNKYPGELCIPSAKTMMTVQDFSQQLFTLSENPSQQVIRRWQGIPL